MWVEAALATTAGGQAEAAGELRYAADRYREAADLYGRIGNVSDRVLALTAAVRADRAAGVPDPPGLSEVRAFALRNRVDLL